GKAVKHDKKEAKQPKKAHAAKGQKAHAKPEAKPSKPEASGKHEAQADAKAKPQPGNASASKGKKTKKTASRGATAAPKKPAKRADAEAPPRPCLGLQVAVDRGGLEGETLPLLDCHGAPLAAARTELSLLARPWSVARPSAKKPRPAKPISKV